MLKAKESFTVLTKERLKKLYFKKDTKIHKNVNGLRSSALEVSRAIPTLGLRERPVQAARVHLFAGCTPFGARNFKTSETLEETLRLRLSYLILTL